MHIYKDRPLVNTTTMYAVGLVIILSISFCLNFYHLKQRSLLDWDEAYYLEVVKTWRAGIDWFIYRIFSPQTIELPAFSSYVSEHGGAINTFAKDGFLIIVLAFSYFLGLYDYTILYVSACFGVFTVLLIYFIGRECFSKISGLLSCGILAISAYQVHYARSGFPQSASVFFLYLAVLLYLRGSLFFSGISAGYAFSCHYNLFWVFFALFISELIYNISSGYGKVSFFSKNILKRSILFFAGASVPVLFWGAISELVKFVLYSNPSLAEALKGSLGIGSFVSYFDRLGNFLIPPLSNTGARTFNPYFYLKLLISWQGLISVILLFAGILYLLYRQLHKPLFKETVVLILFLAPFFYWSFYSWQLGRSFVSAIPAMSLIIGGFIGQGLYRYCERESFRVFIVFLTLLFLVWQGRSQLMEEMGYISGYPSAIKFMQEHQGIKHLSSQYTISRFFVGRKNALDISVSFAKDGALPKLQRLYDNDGYRYVLLDQMRNIFLDSPIVEAADKAEPLFSAAHSTTANLYENDSAGFMDRVACAPQALLVYDIKDIINNLKD